MNIVALIASPRTKGNTAQLVQEVLKGVAEKDATYKVYNLNQMKLQGCQSCYACKSGTSCVIDDGAKQILADIAQADGVIFGTPVYMWDMTGQMKLLVDRLYSFMNPDYSSKLQPGKKVLWVVTQGQPDEKMFLPSFEKAIKVLQFLGFGEGKTLIAGGTRAPEDILKQAETLAKARTLGSWLVQ